MASRVFFYFFNTLSNSSYRAESFDVVLDTGSSDLWIAGPECTSCTSDQIPTFDTSKSTTFQSATTSATISYGSGEVTGTVGSDTVTMAGFTVENQNFRDYPFPFNVSNTTDIHLSAR